MMKEAFTQMEEVGDNVVEIFCAVIMTILFCYGLYDVIGFMLLIGFGAMVLSVGVKPVWWTRGDRFSIYRGPKAPQRRKKSTLLNVLDDGPVGQIKDPVTAKCTTAEDRFLTLVCERVHGNRQVHLHIQNGMLFKDEESAKAISTDAGEYAFFLYSEDLVHFIVFTPKHGKETGYVHRGRIFKQLPVYHSTDGAIGAPEALPLAPESVYKNGIRDTPALDTQSSQVELKEEHGSSPDIVVAIKHSVVFTGGQA